MAFFLSLPLVEPYEFARLGAILCAMAAAFLMIGRALANGTQTDGGMLLDAALLFWAWLLASVFWSEARYVSIIALGTFSLMPLGFFALALSRDSQCIVPCIARVAGLIIAGLAAWALAQYFFLPELLVNGGVRAPFANPNAYAALLSLGFFAGLGWMVQAGEGVRAKVATVFCGLTLGAIIIIGSRGALFSLIAALAVFTFLLRGRLRKQAKQGIAILAFTVLVIVAAAVIPEGRYISVARFTALEQGGYDSIDARLDIWTSTVAMISAHPWLGTGLGTFFLYYPPYRLESEFASAGLAAHNDPLQFWAEAGLPAFVLFYAFAALAARRMVRAVSMLALGDGRRAMMAGLFCGAGAMVMHSHVDFNFAAAPLLLVSGLMLGWWFRETAAVLPEERITIALPARWPVYLKWIIVGAPFLISGIFLQGLLVSEYYTNRAKALALTGQVQEFAASVNAANDAGFGLNARPYIYAALIPLGALQSGGPLPGEEKAEQAARAQEMLGKAQALNPRLVAVYHYGAQVAQAAGDDAQAMALLQQALAVNPMHQPARQALAALHLSQGDKVQALAVLKEGVHWPPRFQDPLPYYNMTAMLAAELGDVQTHRLAAEKIAAWQQQKAQEDFSTAILP